MRETGRLIKRKNIAAFSGIHGVFQTNSGVNIFHSFRDLVFLVMTTLAFKAGEILRLNKSMLT
jgi:hypothetical protein